MLITLNESETTCPVSTQDLMQFVACLDPSQTALIAGLGIAATNACETYLSDYITKRPITCVLSRGESEKTDTFFRSWLSSRSYVAAGFNTVSGQWLQLPTAADSVESVSLGIWGADDILLQAGRDYAIDTSTSPARICFTYNLYVQDFFTNFSHIQVNYTGGIADATSVPTSICLAIKIIVKKLFDNRDTQNTTIIDDGVSFLLNKYRRIPIGGSR